MSVKENVIRTYTTSDGEEFRSRKEALQHEEIVPLIMELDNNKDDRRFDPEEAEWVLQTLLDEGKITIVHKPIKKAGKKS